MEIRYSVPASTISGLKPNTSQRLHYLAFFVDHLPSFISKPNRVTTLLAYICTLCCIWRFWLLHRKWRFNNVFVFGTYGLWIILSWTTQLDDALVTWTAIYLVLPLLSLCSVILHRMLGSNAWKPPTFSIEEANERHELRPMARNEDTEALLNSDEMNKK
ncbi:hypothetical protein CC78DRAFT_350227 [Lojkania enalia]|uniref:Uncharacterized protein n=1 Tax=Lojkania enalia TaxID=147567 RepID=A0A9P4N8B9_9PLEO|nr:hypothetical protein CC78DRAFT_350227 [Didymosphaeria enalia]